MSVNNWSGGTTSELFIYPEGGSFSEGNFELRISLATVEQPQTVFTPLANTNRTLLVLQGSQLLEHQGHHTADLRALEQDSFSGGWTTHCEGLSTNFNVMTKGSKHAEVKVQNIDADTSLICGKTGLLTFIYLLDGMTSFNNLMVNTKESIHFQNLAEFRFQKSAQIVVVSYPLESVL